MCFHYNHSHTYTMIDTDERDVGVGLTDVVQIEPQDITVESPIGNGSFAIVSKARLSPCYESTTRGALPTDCNYALKRICGKTKRGDRHKSHADIIQATLDLKTEVNLLSRIIPRHENLVHLYGVSTAITMQQTFNAASDNNDCFVLLELLQEDTLKDRIDRLRRKESLRSMLTGGGTSPLVEYDSVLNRISTIGIGIAKGMQHIHSCNVILRDLKSDNIGFCVKTGQPKIFDLGFARHADALSRTTEVAGTLR